MPKIILVTIFFILTPVFACHGFESIHCQGNLRVLASGKAGKKNYSTVPHFSFKDSDYNKFIVMDSKGRKIIKVFPWYGIHWAFLRKSAKEEFLIKSDGKTVFTIKSKKSKRAAELSCEINS